MDKPDDKLPSVLPSIPMPSADLINYRFDQVDKTMNKLDSKLDMLTSTFPTREEIAVMKAERDARILEIERQLSSWSWYWKAVFVAVITAVAMAGAAFFIHR